MKYKLKIKIVCICLLTFLFVNAQYKTDLKINKALAVNKNNLANGCEGGCGCIKICNLSSEIVDMIGCFLADGTTANFQNYMLIYEEGNELTKINPYHRLFFGRECSSIYLVFYPNFVLDSRKSDLFDSFCLNSDTLISLSIVTEKKKDGIGNSLIKSGWVKKCFKKKIGSSPVNEGSCILHVCCKDVTPFLEKKIENLKKDDKKGICLALTSVSVIFFILIVLCLMFKLIGKISILFSTHRTMRASGITKEDLKRIDLPTGEIFAAIALAIYEATEMHDEENTIITIKNTARNYSPWNSKIYTLRETPRKK